MILAGRALALVRGREYALPQDIQEIAPDVLRHRLVLSYEALADGVTRRHHRPHPLGRAGPELALRERMTRSAGMARHEAAPLGAETPEQLLLRLEWRVSAARRPAPVELPHVSRNGTDFRPPRVSPATTSGTSTGTSRADGHAVRPVHRGPRAHRVAPPACRRWGSAHRPGRRSSSWGARDTLARLLTRDGNRVGAILRQRDRGDAPAAEQPEPGSPRA
jgi:hypothetical protein